MIVVGEDGVGDGVDVDFIGVVENEDEGDDVLEGLEAESGRPSVKRSGEDVRENIVVGVVVVFFSRKS